MRLSPVNEQHVQWKIIAGWKPKFRSSKGTQAKAEVEASTIHSEYSGGLTVARCFADELEDVVTGGLRAFSQHLSVEMIMGTY
ncbi:hypothetical protein GN244_ATG11533 [Phytophthora infestans]|uniref:Uncharacterized protein n=1 Tax=Phytophthora infestans TaxID=4787 RepID=A0A833WBG6_PHYIN|nr:hypothetical protein GN244_ATG11533 [Phytophthora infestans]KAF4133417.1 hypothetical protein GN958_ATG17393 [Phytophthora infestans]KAF4134956.1 hypothetical protein GN958_ATG15854 [Phytophthora infestans]KAF4138355.1 hypothetical protein GN958_ATG12509 [Phytophthora infestans]KAF4142485.1 hypothetical protein GN958_ATG08294 [Phytophthora infestans]